MILSESQDFLQRVNSVLRGKQSNTDFLEVNVISHYLVALKKIKRDIESQLAADKAARQEKFLEFFKEIEQGYNPGETEQERVSYVSERNRWRADVIRIKNNAESEIDKANLVYNDTVLTLVKAIETHKDAVSSANWDDDTYEIDEELWKAVRTYE